MLACVPMFRNSLRWALPADLCLCEQCCEAGPLLFSGRRSLTTSWCVFVCVEQHECSMAAVSDHPGYMCGRQAARGVGVVWCRNAIATCEIAIILVPICLHVLACQATMSA